MANNWKPCKKCRKCYYGGEVYWMEDKKHLYSCDYYLLTKQHRPCPAGEDCTAYKPRGRSHQKYNPGF